MLRWLAAALLLHQASAAADAARSRNRALPARHPLHELRHEHRLRLALEQDIAFDSYKYELLNNTTLFEYTPQTSLPQEYFVIAKNYTAKRLYRQKRDPHSLIGTFDLSKLFKKKKYKSKQDNELKPSASSLQGMQYQHTGPRPSPDAELLAPSRRLDIVTPLPTNYSIHPSSPAIAFKSFTIPTQIIPTESDHVMTTAVSQGPGKPKPKIKPARKSKGVSKATTSAPNNGRRETRPVLKKKVPDEETVWPVKHAAVVEGDIILGGLMMVHSRSEGATCGPVMAQGGVQALEAMLFALDAAARAGLAPPAVRLGAHVLDDCDNDTYGLEMALDFIKGGSISNIDDEEYECNATAVRKVISGVVGAASSVTSVQVANLLRLFKIPQCSECSGLLQVSFFSTSPELSNKARFEYFTRTIPSDLHQVRAMVEIVKKLGWRYVSIIYEESNYGIKAFEELETLLARNDICIAVKERLVKDSGEADERAYDAIVARLLSRPRARGVIVFGSDQEVAGVMSAVSRMRATDAFGWVGSDGWSARALVSDGNEAAVEGTISVQPQANPVLGFREYFLNLTVENNSRNPWFVEFWEDQFKCRYPGSARTPYNVQYERTCTGAERLSADNIEFEAQLQFVTDAVLAFAHAIRDMHADLCHGKPGLCDAMRPASGATLLRYLRQVHFTGLSGDQFHFDSNGDGPARYNILHFKQVSPGVYRWLTVGRYLDGELHLNMDDIQFKWSERHPPESVCSAECELGQAKQYVEGESCCWHCFNCTQYEVRPQLVWRVYCTAWVSPPVLTDPVPGQRDGVRGVSAGHVTRRH
ncbi:hypothetical protein HF086_002205, partial [Spodoptera exigua]